MLHPIPTRFISAFAGMLALLIALTGCSSADADVSSGAPAIVQDEDLGELAVYEVDLDGELMPAASGPELEIWDLFRRVVTPEYAAERILWYQVGDDPDSALFAWVIESDEDPELWNLAVNLSAAEDAHLLLLTLIHEYAHLLSTGLGQTDESEGCVAVMPSAACTEDGAYLAGFHERFWAGYGDEAPEYHQSDGDVTAAFYAAHDADFVSQYAATNLGEDFAESFMAFVAEPRPSDPDASVVAAKLSYMWEQPALVQIRDRLRAEFGDIEWVEF